MDYKNGPSLSFQRREEERRWKDYVKSHKERLKGVKTTMKKESNNEGKDYLHLQLRLKRLQMEEDKFATIDYENRKLLERIMGIMGKEGRVDNWKMNYKTAGGLHSETKRLEERRIDQENRKLLSRLDRVKGLSYSAPNIPDLIKQTRDKMRANEDKRIKEENKDLKERIDAVRAQLRFTPPLNLQSPKRDNFGHRFNNYVKSLEEENRSYRDRVEGIMKGTGRVDNWNKDFKSKGAGRGNDKEVQIDEENFALQGRIVKAKGTINFQKFEKQYKDTRRMNQLNPFQKAEEARVIEGNKRIQERLVKIMGSSSDFTWNHGEMSKQSDRVKNLNALKKAIDQENQVMSDRLKDMKPTMNTHDQDSPRKPTKASSKNPFAEENKRQQQRLENIKKGKNRLSLSHRLESNASGRTNDNNKENNEEIDTPKQEDGNGEDNEPEENEKAKDYNVPPGYKKKFRKRRKKSKGSSSNSNDELDDDEEEETSSTDSEPGTGRSSNTNV